MESKAPDNRPRRQPLRLPFLPKRADWGEWAWDNRRGVLFVVSLYLIFALVVVWLRIDVGSAPTTEYIEIQFDEEIVEEPEPLEENQERVDFSDVKNLMSNDLAREAAEMERMSNENREEIERLQSETQSKLDANRQKLEQGRQEEQAIIDRAREQALKDDDKRSDNVKQRGNVTVRFSLEGRTSVRLYIPAYRCENGGEIRVNISVDRAGNVTRSSVDRAVSSSDPCLVDMALEAADNSKFNLDTSAPVSQKGTITYIFIPQ